MKCLWMEVTVRAVRVMAGIVAILACGLQPGTAVAQAVSAVGYRSPTDTPAVRNVLPARAPLLAMAQAGDRLVAAGLRGRIVFSDDGGKSWTQAEVPVQVDLVALSFPTPTHGWAVGHRGVVLETTNAGATWVRRFANQQLNELALKFYEVQKASPNSAVAQAEAGIARSIKEASVPSLLDVWFESATAGTLVGTFNTIFRTEDGGVTWTPWMDRTDNPDELHLYAVRGGSNGLYLAGEKGGVWRLDPEAKRWVFLPTGYAGTLFGLVVEGSQVHAYGMRGSVFATQDAGRNWKALVAGRNTGILGGLRLKSGEVLLVDQSGELLRSKGAGIGFVVLPQKDRVPAFSLLQASDGQLFAVGPTGVTAVALPTP